MIQRSFIAIGILVSIAGCAVSSSSEGQSPSSAYRSLVGADASSADGSLRNMGFRDVDAFRTGNTSYTIWYRPRSRECVQMTVARGTVTDLRDIGTHPNCTTGSNDSGFTYERLIGDQASSADGTLRSMGFRDVDRRSSGRRIETIWYNDRRNQCLEMVSERGVVVDLRDIRRHPACTYSGGGGGSASSWRDVIGTAASSADGSLRSMGFEDVDGFREGRVSYTIWYNPRSRACLEMEVARGEVVDLRDIDRHPSCRSGDATGESSFDHLVGAQASSADGSLRRMGYTDVDAFGSGRTRYTIWYNSRSRQCLQMTVARGEVLDLSDIGTHPACRTGGRPEQLPDYGDNGDNGGSNYPSNWVRSLIGRSTQSVGFELRDRGFQSVGSGFRDGERTTTWWNARASHCLQTITRNERIVRVNDRIRSPACY